MDHVLIARRIFEHPAFNHRDCAPWGDNPEARAAWCRAVHAALPRMHYASTLRINDELLSREAVIEAFASALYEAPQWGYKRPWDPKRRECAPFLKAATDVVGGLL